MKIFLVRHGFTKGNYERRYVGVTDDPLCDEGKNSLKESIDTTIKTVYVSPMLRAKQTAEILFPNAEQIVVDGFKEMDFGDFEKKNSDDLSDNKDYRVWVESNCEGEVPNGEKKSDFITRSCRAFDETIKHAFINNEEQIGIVAHGGTIMSILSEFTLPKKDYFDYKTPNGKYWLVIAKKQDWGKVKTLYVKESPKED